MDIQKQIRQKHTGQTIWEVNFQALIPRSLTAQEYAAAEHSIIGMLNEIINPQPETNEKENRL